MMPLPMPLETRLGRPLTLGRSPPRLPRPIILIVINMIRTVIIDIIIIIIFTRPRPAFGRLGLGGSSGGYTYHGYTTHASPRACGARLGQIVQELVEICKNSNVPTFQPFLKLSGKRRNDKTP